MIFNSDTQFEHNAENRVTFSNGFSPLFID